MPTLTAPTEAQVGGAEVGNNGRTVTEVGGPLTETRTGEGKHEHSN